MRISPFRCLTTLAVVCASVFLPLANGIDADSWTLEDVLTKVETTNGGVDAIESTTNLRVRGEVISDGMTYEFLLLKKRPDKVRIHLMFQGRSVETGFDGETGWRRVWVGGRDTVDKLSAAELANANLDIDFDGPLIGDPLPGTERAFDGVERINRIDYFVIRVETPLARTRHYIDSRTFREWRTIREILEAGEVSGTVVTTYSQYRRHKTIWLAEKVERTLPDGKKETIIVKDAEVDPGILDRAFELPRQWSGN
jgi:hypothetical protein